MKKIVILHTDVAPDASEDELDCLRQADTISEALQKLGYESLLMPFVLDLNANMKNIRSHQPYVVFNLVETLATTGSLIHFAPALLDFMHIPYTGCRTDAMYLTSNKPLSKQLMHTAGIATPPWVTSDGLSIGQAAGSLYLIKASWEDASVGLDKDSIVAFTDPAAMVSSLHKREVKLGGACFAESYIDGREFNIAMLSTDKGVVLLPPAEMLFLDYAPDKLKLLDYNAKWVEDTFEHDHTRRTLDIPEEDHDLIATMQAIALRCWHLFGLRGYARVDFRVDLQGKPFVLEINANPCLSLEAGFAAALDRASIPYHDAIGHLVNDALK